MKACCRPHYPLILTPLPPPPPPPPPPFPFNQSYKPNSFHCSCSSLLRSPIVTLISVCLLLLTYLPCPSLQARLPVHLPFSSSEQQQRNTYKASTAHHHSIRSLIQKVRRLQEGEDDEKAQMGSRPPTCDSKCNHCKPCKAVQVPTLPISPNNVKGKKKDKQGNLIASSQLTSNYKPEDWKCTCGNNIFNP